MGKGTDYKEAKCGEEMVTEKKNPSNTCHLGNSIAKKEQLKLTQI